MLGPLLLIFYTDIDVLSNCSMRLYADDLLYRPIHSPKTIKPCSLTDIDALTEFQPTSYSLTVISASVYLCLERGIPPCQLHYQSMANP